MGGNLSEIYEEIYQLVSRLHFNAEYVESMAPVERQIYLMRYKEEQESLNSMLYNKADNVEPYQYSQILGDLSNYE